MNAYKSKRALYVEAAAEKQSQTAEFMDRVRAAHAADPSGPSIEWLAEHEKNVLKFRLLTELWEHDRAEIPEKSPMLELTPELEEKIKHIANKLTARVTQSVAEFLERLPNNNYEWVKHRVLFQILPGNYANFHESLFEFYGRYGESADFDDITDDITDVTRPA
jgi:hypothetical protein